MALDRQNAISYQMKSSLAKPLKLGEMATLLNATLKGDPECLIQGVGTLQHAHAGDITFLASPKYKSLLSQTKASAVILTEKEAKHCPVSTLICSDPKLTFAKAVHLLYPKQKVPPAIHPTAIIGEGSRISPESYIGPYSVIGNGVTIESNVIIKSHCAIGEGSHVGEGTLLSDHVTVYHQCHIGKQCTIHSGVVIGSDGFGFVKEQNRWVKVPQIGKVIIGDHVEIGANTTIDRGAIENTEIGNHVILDNLIQIGHNVKIGEGTAIAACTGIAGSTTVGKHCLIGGGSRINGHIHVADGVVLVGCTNVANSIEKPGAYASGISENDLKTWKKNLARFHQLDELAHRIKQLEKLSDTQKEG